MSRRPPGCSDLGACLAVVPTVTGADPADRVAAAVCGVAGVAGLHGGMFGEVATYLPGHRVLGVRIGEGTAEVHVTLFFDVPVRQTAARVRDAAAGVVGGVVEVFVEDIVARRAG